MVLDCCGWNLLAITWQLLDSLRCWAFSVTDGLRMLKVYSISVYPIFSMYGIFSYIWVMFGGKCG